MHTRVHALINTLVVSKYASADSRPAVDFHMDTLAGATAEQAAAKSTRAPTETATGSFVITKATIKPLQSLTWVQLLRLIKAAHNPRFCGRLSVARSNLANGTSGDFCAFMGGLSIVVRQVLPRAPDPKRQSYIKSGLDVRGNTSIDHAVTAYLEAAFPPHPPPKEWYPPHSPKAAQAWSELHTTLEMVAPTTTEQEKLCSFVVAGLMGYLQKVLAASATFGDVPGEATMVMLHSLSMKAQSQDREGKEGYGLFGKSGSTQLEPTDFWKQIFVGEGCTKTENEASRKNTQELFMGAMVAMAENIEYRYGFGSLPHS